MKKKFSLMLLLATIFSFSTLCAETYNLPTGDGDKGDKIVTESLQFYDAGGANGSASQYSGTKICFTAATAGKQLTINFSKLDIDPEKATLYIYDGDCEYVSWNKIPEGYVAALKAGDTGTTIETTNDEGKMAIFYCHNSSSGDPYDGWEAVVNEITPADMEFKSATASQEGIEDAYRGKVASPIISVLINTEGSGNPLQVNTLTYDFGATNLANISRIALYRTKTATFSTDNLIEETTEITATGSFTDNSTLKLGDNYYWIACDFSTSAVAGEKVDVTCNNITVAGEVKTITNANPEGEVNIDNVILMSAGNTTFPVGDLPISLYDDGGEDGNITQDFSGSVTFTPSTAGKKVMVEFLSVDLFNTSTTGLNDVLKIYNGSSIDEENLSTTVLLKPVTVRSVAADGALTISLVSKTGLPKSGFVARVSEFVPQQMTVKERSVLYPSDIVVCSSQVGKEVIRMNIATENTEPAISLDNVKISIAGNSSAVKNIKLYYTGEDSLFNSSNNVAEVESVTANNTLTLSAPQTLREGDNYVWVTFDINDAQESATVIAYALDSYTCGASTTTVTNEENATCTIVNKYVSKLGNTTVNINGEWDFVSNNENGKYVAEVGIQQVTFLPTDADKIIELDFADFEVAFSTSYYGATATFKIYSGVGTDGELLWEVDDATKATKGPQKLIRSKSADGAITVVFDAEDSGSYYAKKGWNAKVREHKSMPMTVKSVNTFQNNTDIIKPVQKDVEIIGFNVLTTGDLSPLSLQSISLNLKSSTASVDFVKIYSTATDSAFSNATLIAKVAPADALTITFATAQLLAEGRNYFWLAYDMKEGADAEQQIDAALVSINCGAEDVAALNGDPEGERITKNIIDMATEGVQTVTVNGSLMFYDNGGANADYEKSDATIIFKPATAGKVIKAVVRSFKINTNDDLIVRYGEDVNADEVEELSGVMSDDELPMTFTSIDESGAISFELSTGYGTYVNDGWEIEIIEYELQPLSLASVETTILNPTILKGTQDVVVANVVVNVAGDKGSFDVNVLAASLAGTTNTDNISALTLYSTDQDTAFFPSNAIAGVVAGSDVTFDINKHISLPGAYQYWLAINVAADANSGNSIAFAPNMLITSSGLDPIMGKSFTADIQQGVSGDFVIGASADADFATVADAIASLENGVDGAVRFLIEAGTYDEKVFVPAIAGSSPTNTVTFTSITPDAEVKFINNVYSEAPYGEDEKGIWTIDGADYITIDNIEISTTAGYEYIFYVKHNSDHVTLSNSRIEGNYSTSYSGSSTLVKVEGKNEIYCNANYFTLDACHLQGGRIGVDIAGASYVVLPKQIGARIINSTFDGQGSMAIYMQKEEAFTIANNTVTNTVSEANGFKAIDFVAMGGAKVYGNKINLATANYVNAMYIRSDNTSTADALVYNNEIVLSNLASSSASSAIYSSDALFNTHIAYNSILISATEDFESSCGIYINTSASKRCTASSVKHNIVQNKAKGIVLKVGGTNSIEDAELTYSNNTYFTNGDWFYISGGEEFTYDDWNTIAAEENTTIAEVNFLSDNVLDLENNEGLVATATESYVTSDILNRERGEETLPGAYIFYVFVEDVPELSADYPKFQNVMHNTADMLVKAPAAGLLYYTAALVGDEAPTKESLLATTAVELAADVESTIELADLLPENEYVVYYVLSTLRGTSTEVLSSENITTAYLPMAMSTFEDVKTSTLEGVDFEDGTAAFSGFEVDNTIPTMSLGGDNVAAITRSGAAISFTNTTKYIALDGFFIFANGDVTIKATAENETKEKVVTVAEEWTYVNLRDMGNINGVSFEYVGEQDIYIDNFNGTPEELDALLMEGNINSGESIALEYLVVGGVKPYTYAWYNAKNELLSNDADFAISATATADYTLKVVDAWGSEVATKATVSVNGERQIADFEDLYLDEESHVPGNWTAEEDENTHFYSGSYEFSSNAMADWATWWGFGYSNETSTDYNNMNDQFRSAVGHGVDNSENYGVAYLSNYMGVSSIKVTNNDEGDTIPGVYFSNTAWVVEAILNGSGAGDVPFAQDDSLIVEIIGMLDGMATNKISIPLADYRNTNNDEHYYLDSWQWFDLSSLGKIDELNFNMYTSQNNSYGALTPIYLVLDNLGAACPERTTATQFISDDVNTLDLSLLTEFNAADGNISYSVIEQDNGIETTIEDAIASVEMTATEGEVLVLATQKGKKDYMRIPLENQSTTVGNDFSAEANINVWANDNNVYVSCSDEEYSIEIFTFDGRLIFNSNDNVETTTVAMPNDEKMIIVRVVSETTTAVERLFVK